MDTREEDWLDACLASTRNLLVLLNQYYRLYPAVLLVCIVIAIVIEAVATPTYTAMAVIGPPAPSNAGSMMGGLGRSPLAGLTAGMVGGLNTNGRDSYQDFTQLLPSSRLAQVLIDRDHFLQTIYADRWDSRTNQWKKPSALGSLARSVKQLLGAHSPDHPGVDEIMGFLNERLVT